MTSSAQASLRATNSFKEFTKEYIEPTSEKHYKKTEIYRRLTNDGAASDGMTNKLFKYVPNSKTFGNTWDAKHLDIFLSTSPWGQSAGILKTQTTLDQYAASLPQSRNMSLPKSDSVPGGFNSTKLNKSTAIHPRNSYYFRNSERFGPEQNAIHDFTYKVYENNVNQFVTNLPVQQESLQSHYNKNLTRSSAPMDPKALEFSIKEDESMLPQARRTQIEETKKSQKTFKDWKEANKLITKRNRVYHAGFKSGILSLDNPLHDETLIYREEYHQMKALNEEKRKIEAQHKEDLKYLTRTNPQVEFMNKEAKLIDDVPEHKKYYLEKPITAHNGKVRVNMPHTKILQDSHDRLLGAEVKKYSLSRAEYLRNQELRGKKYDILSNVVNDIELKQDRMQKSALRFEHPLGQSMLVKH